MDQRNISKGYQEIAEKDYIYANLGISSGNPELWNNSVISYQQSAEKYLKEVYAQNIGPPQNSHSIYSLLNELEKVFEEFRGLKTISSYLTDLYFTLRYPNERYNILSEDDVMGVIDITTKIRNICLEILNRPTTGVKITPIEFEGYAQDFGYYIKDNVVYDKSDNCIGRVDKGQIYIG